MPPEKTPEQIAEETAAAQKVKDDQLAQLAQTVNLIAEQTQGFNARFEAIEKAPAKSGDDDGTKTPDNDLASAGDLETMSNKDLADTIIKHVSGTIIGQLEPMFKQVNERVDATAQASTTTDLKAQLKELQGEHKDVNDWGVEMKALHSNTPGLSIGQLYNLARAENPEKAKELDAKYDPKPAPGTEQKADVLTPLFGGQVNSGAGEGGDADGKDVDKVADNAFDEIFGGGQVTVT